MVQTNNPVKIIALSAAGLLLLLSGVYIYLVDRSPGDLYLLSEYPVVHGEGRHFLAGFAYRLPVFLHIAGFSMLTRIFFPGSARADYLVPLSWGSLNILLEFGQLYHTDVLPAFSGSSYMWKETRVVVFQYFQDGVFDWLDILSAALAVVLTWIIFKLIKL